MYRYLNIKNVSYERQTVIGSSRNTYRVPDKLGILMRFEIYSNMGVRNISSIEHLRTLKLPILPSHKVHNKLINKNVQKGNYDSYKL